jgi:hypothetical protein
MGAVVPTTFGPVLRAVDARGFQTALSAAFSPHHVPAWRTAPPARLAARDSVSGAWG